MKGNADKFQAICIGNKTNREDLYFNMDGKNIFEL